MINTVSIKEALDTSGIISINPKGQSMFPYIKDTDTILIVKPVKPLKKYDCVLFFERKNTYVLHRLMKIDGDTLVTLGDNNVNYDRPVRRSEVVGVLQGFYRKGKYTEVLDKKITFAVKFGCLYPVKRVRMFFYRTLSLLKGYLQKFKRK